MAYDPDICSACAFQSLCTAPVSFGEGAKPLPSEMVEKLARYEEIKGIAKEAEILRKELTAAFEGQEILLAGDYYAVSGKWINVKGRIQERKEIPPRKYWKWAAVRLPEKTLDKPVEL